MWLFQLRRWSMKNPNIFILFRGIPGFYPWRDSCIQTFARLFLGRFGFDPRTSRVVLSAKRMVSFAWSRLFIRTRKRNGRTQDRALWYAMRDGPPVRLHTHYVHKLRSSDKVGCKSGQTQPMKLQFSQQGRMGHAVEGTTRIQKSQWKSVFSLEGLPDVLSTFRHGIHNTPSCSEV